MVSVLMDPLLLQTTEPGTGHLQAPSLSFPHLQKGYKKPSLLAS